MPQPQTLAKGAGFESPLSASLSIVWLRVGVAVAGLQQLVDDAARRQAGFNEIDALLGDENFAGVFVAAHVALLLEVPDGKLEVLARQRHARFHFEQ
jgi:hypothetical protein